VSAAVAIGAVLLTACSSDPEPDPFAVLSEQPSPPPPPAPVDAQPQATAAASPIDPASPSETATDDYAMPDEVSPEYVDRVTDAIYQRWGEISREVLAMPVDPQGALDPEMYTEMGALFAGQYLRRRIGEQEDALRSQRQRDLLLSAQDFEQPRFRTVNITRADDSCIVAVGDFDTSATAANGDSSDALSAISLQHTPPGRRRDDHNPTPWKVRDLLINYDVSGNPLPDETMLRAALEDFGASLENSCQ
jgi:hypothetical protein